MGRRELQRRRPQRHIELTANSLERPGLSDDIVVGRRIVIHRAGLGRDEEPRAMMTEIIGVLGGGVLFRQIARQMVGLIPIAGLLPKVAIASACIVLRWYNTPS